MRKLLTFLIVPGTADFRLVCFRHWLTIADAAGLESPLNCQEFLKLHAVEIGKAAGV
jgi:hypothetical protein